MSSKAYKELKCIATCHTGVSGGSDDNIINQFVHTVYRWYLAGMGDDHRDRFMELLPELTDTEWAKIMLNFVTSVNVPVAQAPALTEAINGSHVCPGLALGRGRTEKET